MVNGHFQHLENTVKIMRLEYANTSSYIIEYASEPDTLLCLTFPTKDHTLLLSTW